MLDKNLQFIKVYKCFLLLLRLHFYKNRNIAQR